MVLILAKVLPIDPDNSIPSIIDGAPVVCFLLFIEFQVVGHRCENEYHSITSIISQSQVKKKRIEKTEITKKMRDLLLHIFFVGVFTKFICSTIKLILLTNQDFLCNKHD